MDWLEYNIHVLNRIWQDIVAILTDLLEPFVKDHKNEFTHWHYLIEPDNCRSNSNEIRVRFEGEPPNLKNIKTELTLSLSRYSLRTGLTMREDEPLGSHEGCHGKRGEMYLGEESEDYGEDWPSIVEILQIGSKSAIEILQIGRSLKGTKALGLYSYPNKQFCHQYYLHLPANQLLVEP